MVKLFYRRWIGPAFMLPVLIIGIYFAFRGVYPLSNSTVLTVDLGQQYVDFLAFLHDSLWHQPANLIYSFQKGLGGELWGTSAYYLMSPLNLLAVLFPKSWLPTTVFIITLLKYGLAAVSMGWLLRREHLQRGWPLIIYTTAYALMAWMIANQLNIIWTDVLYLLPLVIAGVNQLSRQESPWLYVGCFAYLIVVNYYMAWMVGLFVPAFLLWQLSRQANLRKTILPVAISWLKWTSLVVLLSAVILLPTMMSLLVTKGSNNSTSWSFSSEYNPLKIISKLFPATFNFESIKKGQPNLYVGQWAFLGAVYYLITNRDRLRSRLVAFVILAGLFTSFFFVPFDLVWHMTQFPIWYPSRFSFLWSFFIVYLAATTLKLPLYIKWWQQVLLLLLVAALITISSFQLHHVSGFKITNIVVGGLLMVFTIDLWVYGSRWPQRVFKNVALILTTFDMGYNAVVSLQKLSYLDYSAYRQEVRATQTTVKQLKQVDASHYRITKNYYRSMDDALQTGYYGCDFFGSTIETNTKDFLAAIGQDSEKSAAAYINGTQWTDALLNFRYFFIGQTNINRFMNGMRPDWEGLAKVNLMEKAITVGENPNALGWGYLVSSQVLTTKLNALTAIENQEKMYQGMLGASAKGKKLFSQVTMPSPKLHHVRMIKKRYVNVYWRQQANQPGEMTFDIVPTTNDSYYLSLSGTTHYAATLTVNGEVTPLDISGANTMTVNIAHRQKGKHIRISFHLKKGQSLWLGNIQLYLMRQNTFSQALQQLKRHYWHVTVFKPTQVSGTIQATKTGQVLMTTIPYSKGWHVQVDGQPVAVKKAFNTFIAIPIPTGKHTVTLVYRQPYLGVGMLISAMAIGISGWILFQRKEGTVN